MNITYLLGAGASYNALPIVEQIPTQLEEFAKDFAPMTISEINKWEITPDSYLAHRYLNNVHNTSFKTFEAEYKIINSFYQDIKWLQTEAINHTSLDTFAKKLFLQDENDKLKRLKLVLSCFFLYVQTKKFDKRYDSFFASILDNLTLLPGNLKVLSWNYDSQLEIAFSNFSNYTINRTKRTLNLHSNGDVSYEPYNTDKFCVYKINGTTNVKNGEFDVKNILSDFKIDSHEMVEIFLSEYKKLSDYNYSPNLTFAWENSTSDKGFFPNLEHSVSETEILIVIGYSFPFFNRKTDEFILDSMPKLQKICVQDPYHANSIIDKMKSLVKKRSVYYDHALRDVTYVPITYKDQFYIPIEF